MSGQWLSGFEHVDLSGHRGNGMFSPGSFRGVILHVNASGRGSNGTSISWFVAGGGPNEVCPTFQVLRDGHAVQFLPLNWQPWCQIDGNYNYGAIETGGDPSEPLNAAQLDRCATIVRAYHDVMGMRYLRADAPGQYGIGTHQMGGQAWGGHPCPGTIRAAQREQILQMAAGRPLPVPTRKDPHMPDRLVQDTRTRRVYLLTSTLPPRYISPSQVASVRAGLQLAAPAPMHHATLGAIHNAMTNRHPKGH